MAISEPEELEDLRGHVRSRAAVSAQRRLEAVGTVRTDQHEAVETVDERLVERGALSVKLSCVLPSLVGAQVVDLDGRNGDAVIA